MILRLDPPNPTHFMRSFKLAIPVLPLGITSPKKSLKILMDRLLRLKQAITRRIEITTGTDSWEQPLELRNGKIIITRATATWPLELQSVRKNHSFRSNTASTVRRPNLMKGPLALEGFVFGISSRHHIGNQIRKLIWIKRIDQSRWHHRKGKRSSSFDFCLGNFDERIRGEGVGHD